MSLATILSIVSALLALARWFVGYTEQNKWIKAGEAQAILKGLEDADKAIVEARNARATVRDQHIRDPASRMSNDEFQRPD